ncbi:MAG: hypothetical protein APF80_04690 [Alphaproteobacteria bacterium BRH_c36]|nr:MAG: hypothetical protein APF80_04690 [Alphaproteobacteria bacterium BRH_c36]
MKALEVEEHARKLRAAHGDKAVAEAAQKAAEMEKLGRDEEASDWRQIEKALLLLRGPHES